MRATRTGHYSLRRHCVHVTDVALARAVAEVDRKELEVTW
jgi:hypothetical protein